MQALINTNVSYNWQIVHEIMMDDDFKFSSDGLLVSNPLLKRFTMIVLKSVELENINKFKKAITALSNKEETEDNKEIITKHINKLRSLLSSVTNEDESHTVLDADLLIQMIKTQSYGKQQLCNLIERVCSRTFDKSIFESPDILIWKQSVIEKINNNNDDIFELVSSIFYELINILIEKRTMSMNVKLVLYRPIIKIIGAEMERKEILKAIENEQLCMHKTELWFNLFKNKYKTEKLTTRDKIISIHRDAMKKLLEDLSMAKKVKLSSDILPETLVMDVYRLDIIKNEIKRLAISVSLFILSKQILSNIGVTITKQQSQYLQDNILAELSDKQDIKQLCSNVFLLIQNISGPQIIPDSMISSLLLCADRRDGGIRSIFTKRIINVITDTKPFKVSELHPSLLNISDNINNLSTKTKKLCSHLEQIYSQLFTFLLSDN